MALSSRFSLLLVPFLLSSNVLLAQTPPQVIISVSPASVPTSGGTEVVVLGENLFAPPICGSQPGSCSANFIQIGYFALQMIDARADRLVGRTHQMAAGTYDLVIVRADGAVTRIPEGVTVGGLGYERVLIPIVISEEVSGAHGSRWRSQLVAYNGSTQTVRLEPFPGACDMLAGPGPCPYDIAPSATQNVTAIPRAQGFGALLYIPLSHKDDLDLQLRIQDVSRQALTWGTEIPVVRGEDVFSDETHLLNVPTEDRFRLTLRIYNFYGESAAPGPAAVPIYVRVHPMNGNNIIASTIVALTGSTELPDFPRYPGYAQLDLLSLFPAIVNQGPIRVVVGGAGYFVRYWAFLSITNNETQHVTTVTPQ